VDDHDLVRELGDLREHVARDQHGSAARGERAEELAQPPDPLGIEPVCRLVEHQQPRPAQQRAGDAQPLAHAERVAADPAAGRSRELDLLEHLVHARRRDPGRRREHAQVVPPRAGGMEALRLEDRPTVPSGSRSRAYGCPSTSASPEVGRRSPSSARSVDVLPAPLGPRKPVMRPGAIAKLRPSTATVEP
jgi:hypothetical protein